MSSAYIGVMNGTPGSYGIYFPDLPGCTATGETVVALRDAAATNIREWQRDAAVGASPARSWDELMDDPAIRAQIDAGDNLLLVSVWVNPEDENRHLIAMQFMVAYFWQAVFDIVRSPARYVDLVQAFGEVALVDDKLVTPTKTLDANHQAIFDAAANMALEQAENFFAQQAENFFAQAN